MKKGSHRQSWCKECSNRNNREAYKNERQGL
jgi:hypothetical protein